MGSEGAVSLSNNASGAIFTNDGSIPEPGLGTWFVGDNGELCSNFPTLPGGEDWLFILEFQ
ncbi:hypothetical protein SAMN05660330_01734 [Desulforhopalus singaporensis]|uniref:Uncharacterized protein n=2 Tax=Desulforhopalus singaporensis TaxID=91360 RepID=A0A1H0PSN1_9BACT|nr:hypothetical protein SAMN05660330_01734 [Desulforhopalus singaporensis]